MASYRKTTIIYNPLAGRLQGRGRERLEKAAHILRESGHEVTSFPTTAPGTAGEIARRSIAEGADLIVAAGGDGTVNEVAEGMVHSTVPLGILPAGTANVLAMETGMSTKLETAARALAGYTAARISVGRMHFSNGAPGVRHFLMMAGIGLDARIVYNISAPLKRRLGKGAYWVAGWSLLGRTLDEFEVKIDGRARACSFALVSKVRNYGGDLEIARSTSLLDDRFEVVLFEGRSSLRYVKYFTGVMLNRLQGMKGVSILRAERMCISPAADSRVYIQIDGECAGHLPGSVEIVKDALTVLIPPQYQERSRAGGG